MCVATAFRLVIGLILSAKDQLALPWTHFVQLDQIEASLRLRCGSLYLLLVELVQPVGTLLLVIRDVLHLEAPGRDTVGMGVGGLQDLNSGTAASLTLGTDLAPSTGQRRPDTL